MDLKFTPLVNQHKKLKAQMAPFGGWLMPIQYSGIIREHNWTRRYASLFDICHMGEFIVQGDARETNLENIITFNLQNMPLGSCHYGFMLNEKGGLIDDLIVYRLGREEWMIVVNAAPTLNDAEHIKKHLSNSASFKNISDFQAKLDLQGPESENVLKALAGDGIARLSYYTFSRFNILGEECIVSRTGYTGELGYEIYISAKNVEQLWNKLLEDERVNPAGLGARDTLRLEMGYVLYGQDLDQNTTPLEAGMDKFLDFNKDFIGRDALLKQREQGISRSLVRLRANSRRSPRHNYKIFKGQTEIGFVTSGSFSPSLSCAIGMGYVDSKYNQLGSEVTIRQDRIEIEASIVEKPFYKNGTAKAVVV